MVFAIMNGSEERVTKCTLSSDKVLFTKNIVHYEMAKEIVQAFCIVLVSISCIHNYITNIRGLHLRKALENTSLCVEDGRTSSTNDGYKKLAFCS